MENITTTIRAEDKQLLRERNIPVAHAIRMFCENERNQITKVAETNIRELRERNEKLAKKLNSVMENVGKVLDEKQFNQLLGKI